MKKQIALIFAILMIAISSVWPFAYSEEQEKWPPDDIMLLNGDGLEMSNASVELYSSFVFRVDIEKKYVDENRLIQAEFSLPYIPPALYNVILWDGWHTAYTVWEVSGPHTLKIRFGGEQLKDFYMVEHLYVIMECSYHNMK